MERFLEKFELGENGCWLWTAARFPNGYGKFRFGFSGGAHRFAYKAFVGDPGNLTIDHLCRVRHCVNPEHLEAVSLKENVQRAVPFRSSRMSHPDFYPCGHGRTPDNTNGKGSVRQCRTCNVARSREYRNRSRA